MHLRLKDCFTVVTASNIVVIASAVNCGIIVIALMTMMKCSRDNNEDKNSAVKIFQTIFVTGLLLAHCNSVYFLNV